MTTTDRINILNALEETKQQLPEQLYKTAIESLAKFVPEEEKDVEAEELARVLAAEEEEEAKVFFSELKKYRVSFNLETPYPDIELPDEDGCGCRLDNMVFERKRIHLFFYLHPVLVDFLLECDKTNVINGLTLRRMTVSEDAVHPVGYHEFCHKRKRRGLSGLIYKQYEETIGSVLANQCVGFKGTLYSGCQHHGNIESREYEYYSRTTLHKVDRVRGGIP